MNGFEVRAREAEPLLLAPLQQSHAPHAGPVGGDKDQVVDDNYTQRRRRSGQLACRNGGIGGGLGADGRAVMGEDHARAAEQGGVAEDRAER